jgi:AcrR family transcriptional regulator
LAPERQRGVGGGVGTVRRGDGQMPEKGGLRSTPGGARRDDRTSPAGGRAGVNGAGEYCDRVVDRVGGRSGVASIQRTRMITAMAELARERGAGQVTVAHIVERAGISRRTFYEFFGDREGCFMAAFEEGVQRAAARVIPAFKASGAWRDRVRAGLGALLEFLDDEPLFGPLCVVDALGGGPQALERRTQIVESLIDAVAEGGEECKGALRPTRLTAEGVVGAVLAVLHARMTAGDQRPMVELLGPLMGMIVLPYRGPAVAGRELSRPPTRRRRAVPPERDPLRDLGMRLTYRTVLVLGAVASYPGSSNRTIANASGVVDQAQISKLLVRLEHRGLISNQCSSSGRGEPNAWRLTLWGEEVEQAIRGQTTPAGV